MLFPVSLIIIIIIIMIIIIIIIIIIYYLFGANIYMNIFRCTNNLSMLKSRFLISEFVFCLVVENIDDFIKF